MTASTATGQRCLYCGKTYPLYPPIVAGCPACATDTFKAPLELTFEELRPLGTVGANLTSGRKLSNTDKTAVFRLCVLASWR